MDASSNEAREARRRAWRHWSVRRFALGREPGDNLEKSITVAERLAMMWPRALEAWTLTGRPFPDYDRATAPVRIGPLSEAE